MALVPETQAEKIEAEKVRCLGWIAKLPVDQLHYYCPHGTYWGVKGSLKFMSSCCKPVSEST